ncbi:unnamed protein product [Rotaria magnacalcarata]|uniref:Uncharacterized protein n=3 Tax=Rotaria magnacalcarata TaxID=392030 RepID=A0A816UHW3_9BILA|nr:unnamed protein product [Rotaria magnacalcarata]CAF1617244.1 unnamed protein product [Rotaria magnacalcarata]CAF2102504.1 unnamed protein product [Rotaria magnacalcarata]CAF3814026.1 unnamed protein product [Rotaria magnacalcarata]
MLLLLLLSLILLYIHSVILNKVDLVLKKAIVSIRCPNGKVSYSGRLPTPTKIDELRSYFSNPYLIPSDDIINIFIVNALIHKYTNKKTLETNVKLHLTLIHESEIKIAENIKLIDIGEGKFCFTFYIWFVKRDWIIRRLNIDFDSHPCQHKHAFPDAVFIPFCYYTINATKSVAIEEINDEYDHYLNKATNSTSSTSHSYSATKKSTTNKKKLENSTKKNLLQQKKKRIDSSSTYIQTNLTTIIIITIICLRILIDLPLILFCINKRKKQKLQAHTLIEAKQSSVDSIISRTGDETSENSFSPKEKIYNSLIIHSNMLDDIQKNNLKIDNGNYLNQNFKLMNKIKSLKRIVMTKRFAI